MGFTELVLIGISLAMDAFAVSICKGLSMKKMNWKKAVIIGLYFGIFQALMPTLGYFLGSGFDNLVTSIDHWIVFILLFFIGLNMIEDSFSKETENNNDNIDFKTMLILALATSIDALAVGVTFAFLRTNIFIPLIFIGIITFAMSFLGVKIGNKFGDRLKNKSEKLGGIILILMGIKILLDHFEVF